MRWRKILKILITSVETQEIIHFTKFSRSQSSDPKSSSLSPVSSKRYRRSPSPQSLISLFTCSLYHVIWVIKCVAISKSKLSVYTSSRKKALFNTARFFLTLDPDFRIGRDEDGETETLIISLEINGVTHFRNFSPFSFLSEARSFPEARASHPVPSPVSFCLRPILSQEICTQRVLTPKAES